MVESFVMHSEYIEDLPEEYKGKFFMYIYNYGIHGQVPEVSGLEKTVWTKIQRRIDADRQSWEDTVNARSEAGRRGGAPKGNQNARKNNQNNQNNQEQAKQAKQAVSEFDYVSEFEYESELESVASAETVSPPPTAPVPTEYAKEVLEILAEHKFPCCQGNLLSFIQRDFKLGLAVIHERPDLAGIHSDDILSALKNYCSVVEDPDCYLTSRLTFDRIAGLKNFRDFLPDNFVRDNFLRFGTEKKVESHPPKINPGPELPASCPACKNASLTKKTWSVGSYTILCDRCGSWAEHLGVKGWDWEISTDVGSQK